MIKRLAIIHSKVNLCIIPFSLVAAVIYCMTAYVSDRFQQRAYIHVTFFEKILLATLNLVTLARAATFSPTPSPSALSWKTSLSNMQTVERHLPV